MNGTMGLLLTDTEGIFICPNGAQDGQCNLNGTRLLPNITSTVTIYGRTATVATFRSNYTIFSVSDLGKPKLDPEVDLVAFRQAIDWLLDFSPANIPATSSIVQFFWSGQPQIDNRLWAELYNTFQSILAFPNWLFNANNFGNIEL